MSFTLRTCLLLCLLHNSITFELKVIKSLHELKFTPTAQVARSVNSKLDSSLAGLFLNESIKLNVDLELRKNGPEPLFQGNLITMSTGGSGRVNQIGRMAKIALGVQRSIAESYNYEPADYGYLEKYQAPSEYCPYVLKPYCDFDYPYRTMDGSCNNRVNVWWGQSETPYKRLLAPAYDDYLNEPRRRSTVTGKPLPNPRTVAMNVHFPDHDFGHVTTLFVHYSQFIDHDITLTSITSDEHGLPIKCSCKFEHPDCVNIKTPAEDRHNRDQECMVTPRSTASYGKFECNLGAREQLNLLTHWLDLSQTYGNNLEKNLELRMLKGGLLNSSIVPGMKRPYLPFTLDGSCLNVPKKTPCFLSGDMRTNQNTLLVSLQTLWHREHNRVAKILAALNPHWHDEKIFQETRRLVTAQYQHIVYAEWLPILIGKKAATLYDLIPLNQNYFYGYDATVYPNVANEFSTAAFRFGHSLVRSSMLKTDKNYRVFANVSLQENVFTPQSAFHRGGLDAFIRGSLVEVSHAFDPNVNAYLSNQLFVGLNKHIPTHRFSLPALNINRGRDHGLPAYNKYRHLCGLNYAYSFDELYNIPSQVRHDLRKTYDHVDDIDLFTGGLSELPIDGGLIGPTFACIIAKQFRDLKYGDRFYYENGLDEQTKFTVRQLDELRKSNVARVLCDNVELDYIQKNPFRKADLQKNPLLNCVNVERIDYSAWKEFNSY